MSNILDNVEELKPEDLPILAGGNKDLQEAWLKGGSMKLDEPADENKVEVFDGAKIDEQIKAVLVEDSVQLNTPAKVRFDVDEELRKAQQSKPQESHLSENLIRVPDHVHEVWVRELMPYLQSTTEARQKKLRLMIRQFMVTTYGYVVVTGFLEMNAEEAAEASRRMKQSIAWGFYIRYRRMTDDEVFILDGEDLFDGRTELLTNNDNARPYAG